MNFFKKIYRYATKIIYRNIKFWLRDYFAFRQLKRRPPELMWKISPRCPITRYDAGSVQIKNKLYTIGGFHHISQVINFVDVFDLKKNRWIERFKMPDEMPETHHGMIGDGERFIYHVGGQKGPYCSSVSNDCYILDCQSNQWGKLPPLPQARYAPTIQLWNGRLHVLGGSKEDRYTPATEHWSIAVANGKALEQQWKTEVPIPRAGVHRPSAILDNCLYVLGGQEGDWMAIPGDPLFRGTPDVIDEIIYDDVFKLEPGSNAWQKMSPMPVKTSHTEFSVIRNEHCIAIIGGVIDKDPQTKVFKITDQIQVYNCRTDQWRLAGRLPYRIKHAMAAYYDGWVYVATGQRDKSIDNPSPGGVLDRVWRAKFSF